MAIIFNPTFPYRFIHMVMAAYLTTAFVVGGVGGFYLLRKRFVPHARIMFGMAMLMAVFVAPLQLLFGDMHGLNTFEHQPAKVAAMEGLWETQRGAPLKLFGWPDQEAEETKYALNIPKLSSLILTHDLDGEVKGLKDWPKAERPPAALVFWTFRIMVGIGMAMILTGVFAAFLYWRKRLFETRWFQWWCLLLAPAGFISVLAGWFVTEVGRQPYIVYGVLLTAETASPVSGVQVALSLLAFVIIYGLVFGAGVYYIVRLILKGPGENTQDAYGTHGVDKPPIVTDLVSESGGEHV
jgi:cytochrome d ubiquinol oxidase subunit I